MAFSYPFAIMIGLLISFFSPAVGLLFCVIITAVYSLVSPITSIFLASILPILFFTFYFGDFTYAILVFFVFFLPGITIALCFKAKRGFAYTVLATSGVSFISIFGILFYISILMKQTIIDMLIMPFKNHQAIVLIFKLFELSQDEILKSIANFLPSILIIVCIFIAFFTVVFTKNILARLGYNISFLKPFSEFRLANSLTLLMFSSLLAANLTGGFTSVVWLNIFLVFLFIHFFAGISFIDFLLKPKLKNPIARLFIYALSAIFIPFFLFSILGILDTLLNFRKLLRGTK